VKPLSLLLFAALTVHAGNWADRAEYDLALAVRAELVPQKRIEALDRWTAKYPKSEQAPVRHELYFAAYQATGDRAHMLDTAAEMLAAQPGNAFGAYWFTVLLPDGGAAPPARLDLGEKAAATLVAGPNQVLARRTLAWIQMQRKNYPAAEAELRKCLALDPAHAETSAWLGTVLALEQQPEKYVPALWQLARAAATLPADERKPIAGTLERLYSSYHGEAEGLDRLLAAAAKSAEPPAGFDIESAAVIAVRKQDAALALENPRLAEWVKTRRSLAGPDGEKYFTDTLRGNPFVRIKGALIQATPDDKPTELVVGVVNPAAPEIVLKLSAPLKNAALPGTEIEFEGTVDSFSKSPFSLTLLAEPSNIYNWPKK
jgi:tetratricopeptide (TPR) repeat protein